MEDFESMVSLLDYTLDSNRKRHIVGGILMSISLFFGGLAFTAMTIKNKEDEENE